MTSNISEVADFWRYDIGVNVLPADTKNKKPLVSWSEWQDKPIPERLHTQWKEQGAFLQGIAIIPGKVWHNEDKKHLYFMFIDADTQTAIDELCIRESKIISLQDLSMKFLVEQHKDNPQKAHIYFFSPIPFPKKNADSTIGLEVKGLGEHGIAFCFPSTHKDGMPYEIIGTNQPVTLTMEQARELMQHINQISIKHGLQYLEKESPSANISSKLQGIIRNLVIDPSMKILQGQRHITLISAADSILFRHLGKGKNKSERWLKEFFHSINYQLCDPEPLPQSETDSIWNCALAFVKRTREEQKGDKDSEAAESTAQIALRLAEDQCQELFLDQFGLPYASIKIHDHVEILSLKSSRFKNWLCRAFYTCEQKILNNENVTNLLNILKAKAEFDGITRNLGLRVAGIAEEHYYTIYYDLTNKDWQVIKITKDGWGIENMPTIFRRFNNQQPQIYPSKSEEYQSNIFDRFMSLVNVKSEDNQLLLKCYIISLFYPDIPKPVLMLHGEQGSAKSTLQELRL